MNTNVYDRQIIESGTEGFAKIIPIDKNIDDFKEIPIIEEVEAPDNVKFISKGELETNRLKISELKELPVCKNYARGEPSSRLYLKNLAKDVEDSDLKFIFGRYIDWNNQTSISDIRIKPFLAAALHFDFNAGSVICFCGERDTCEYKDYLYSMCRLTLAKVYASPIAKMTQLF